MSSEKQKRTAGSQACENGGSDGTENPRGKKENHSPGGSVTARATSTPGIRFLSVKRGYLCPQIPQPSNTGRDL